MTARKSKKSLNEDKNAMYLAAGDLEDEFGLPFRSTEDAAVEEYLNDVGELYGTGSTFHVYKLSLVGTYRMNAKATKITKPNGETIE